MSQLKLWSSLDWKKKVKCIIKLEYERKKKENGDNACQKRLNGVKVVFGKREDAMHEYFTVRKYLLSLERKSSRNIDLLYDIVR